MPIPTFDGDLEIIQALDDEPNDVGGLTAAQLKAKFDEGPEALRDYINNTLIPSIRADMIPFGKLSKMCRSSLLAWSLEMYLMEASHRRNCPGCR